MRISIVIPVLNPPAIKAFIDANLELLIFHQVIVIDSGGGEYLSKYADVYINEKMSLSDARKLGYQFADEEFTLNLDCDVVIPDGYIDEAVNILKLHHNVSTVSLFIDRPMHHMGILDFGCSLWKTKILKHLYDYGPHVYQKDEVVCLSQTNNAKHFVHAGFPYCECWYMWRKLKTAGYELDVIKEKLFAKHLK